MSGEKQELDLFGMPITTPYRTDVVPVSVIDISAQGVRSKGGHDECSSRSEYSPFPKEVSALCFEYFMRDSTLVFDPFAGWGERGATAKEYGKAYVGFDLSEDAIRIAQDKGVKNTLADSRTATIPKHDGLVTCPPYWSLEIYNGHGLDRAKTWEAFQDEYQAVLERCWAQASHGATYCIMVGEWRANHKYYDLEGVTRRIMHALGADMFDQITVSRKNISKIKIMLPQAKRLGYTVRVHESLLVYKKPC